MGLDFSRGWPVGPHYNDGNRWHDVGRSKIDGNAKSCNWFSPPMVGLLAEGGLPDGKKIAFFWPSSWRNRGQIYAVSRRGKAAPDN